MHDFPSPGPRMVILDFQPSFIVETLKADSS